MDIYQFTEILKEASSSDDVIEEIKQKLKKEYPDTYKEWKNDKFNINHVFALNINLNHVFALKSNHCLRESTLLHAADFSCLKIVSCLIDKGADVNLANKYGYSPLHFAAENGNEKVVELLLEKGADVNANECVWSPLHTAARSGNVGIVKLLLEKGAKVNMLTVRQETPLHIAAEYGYEGVARLLLESGAVVNAVDGLKYTPLHMAVASGNEKVVELFLAKGAKTFVKNHFGETPKGCVNWARYDAETKNKIIRLLEEAEAKQSKKGDEEMGSHFMQGDTDSDYEEEELEGSDEQHNSPLVSLHFSQAEKQSRKSDEEMSSNSMQDDAALLHSSKILHTFVILARDARIYLYIFNANNVLYATFAC